MLKSRKKICFISIYAYPLFNVKSKVTFGGAEVDLYQFSTKLAEDDNLDVSFIVGNFGQQKVEKIDNVNVVKSFLLHPEDSFLKRFKYLGYFFHLLYKIDADIYFTESPTSLVVLTSLFSKFRGKKHIYRTASSIDCNRQYIEQNGVKGRLFEYGLTKATQVLTQNKSGKHDLKFHHGIEAQILRNPIKILDKKSSKNIILWVGRCEPLKQPEVFIELAKRVDGKFVMVCSKVIGHEEYFEKTRETAKKYGVNFFNFVPYSKISKLFDKAKVFVNTSTYEGFPNTFLQAGASKCPIISLNVNPDKFITRFNCGYHSEGNFTLLKSHLKQLLKKDQIWREKSTAISTYIKDKHEINKIITELKEKF